MLVEQNGETIIVDEKSPRATAIPADSSEGVTDAKDAKPSEEAPPENDVFDRRRYQQPRSLRRLHDLSTGKWATAPCNQQGNDSTLLFESRFEGGNLCRVTHVKDQEYDMYLEPDAHSQGRTGWFSFMVSNIKRLKTYKFNIINMSQDETALFARGMKPIMYSTVRKGWLRTQGPCSYQENYLTRTKNPKRYYNTLSFEWEGILDGDICLFSPCHPYSLTDMRRWMNGLLENETRAEKIDRYVLCSSPAGNPVDILFITNPDPSEGDVKHYSRHHSLATIRPIPETVPVIGQKKKIAVLLARLQGGDCASSYTISGLVDFLTGPSPEAEQLLDEWVFVVLPMVNPDAVVAGEMEGLDNKGRNLTRCWGDDACNVRDHPALIQIRRHLLPWRKDNRLKYVAEVRNSWEARNLYMAANRTGPHMPHFYMREKVFPTILDRKATLFALDHCSWDLVEYGDKSLEFKAYCWLYLKTVNAFTIYASAAGPDAKRRSRYRSMAYTHFEPHDYQEFGKSIAFCFFDIDLWGVHPERDTMKRVEGQKPTAVKNSKLHDTGYDSPVKVNAHMLLKAVDEREVAWRLQRSLSRATSRSPGVEDEASEGNDTPLSNRASSGVPESVDLEVNSDSEKVQKIWNKLLERRASIARSSSPRPPSASGSASPSPLTKSRPSSASPSQTKSRVPQSQASSNGRQSANGRDEIQSQSISPKPGKLSIRPRSASVHSSSARKQASIPSPLSSFVSKRSESPLMKVTLYNRLKEKASVGNDDKLANMETVANAENAVLTPVPSGPSQLMEDLQNSNAQSSPNLDSHEHEISPVYNLPKTEPRHSLREIDLTQTYTSSYGNFVSLSSARHQNKIEPYAAQGDVIVSASSIIPVSVSGKRVSPSPHSKSSSSEYVEQRKQLSKDLRQELSPRNQAGVLPRGALSDLLSPRFANPVTSSSGPPDLSLNVVQNMQYTDTRVSEIYKQFLSDKVTLNQPQARQGPLDLSCDRSNSSIPPVDSDRSPRIRRNQSQATTSRQGTGEKVKAAKSPSTSIPNPASLKVSQASIANLGQKGAFEGSGRRHNSNLRMKQDEPWVIDDQSLFSTPETSWESFKRKSGITSSPDNRRILHSMVSRPPSGSRSPQRSGVKSRPSTASPIKGLRKSNHLAEEHHGTSERATVSASSTQTNLAHKADESSDEFGSQPITQTTGKGSSPRLSSSGRNHSFSKAFENCSPRTRFIRPSSSHHQQQKNDGKNKCSPKRTPKPSLTMLTTSSSMTNKSNAVVDRVKHVAGIDVTQMPAWSHLVRPLSQDSK